MFSLPCSTASAMTFPSQSPRHQGGQDSAAPRAAVREILRSWAGSVSHRVVSLHAHTWAWQLEDFLVLPALLKVPADVVTGSISSPCSLPLWPLCCLQDLGVPRVWFPTLCSLSKGARMLPAPLAPPCAQDTVPSPLSCYIPSLRKTVTLGQMLTVPSLARVIPRLLFGLCTGKRCPRYAGWG